LSLNIIGRIVCLLYLMNIRELILTIWDLLIHGSHKKFGAYRVIKLIHLQGFKSAADVRIEQAIPFSVFAGSNGAGKSNLVDGLAFFGAVVKRGAVQAIRDFGGYGQIHCFQHKDDKASSASLELKIILKGKPSHYIVHIHDMNTQPVLEEKLWVNDELILKREKSGKKAEFFDQTKNEWQELPDFSDEMSILMLFSSSLLYVSLRQPSLTDIFF